MKEELNRDIIDKTLTKIQKFHQRLSEKFTSMGLDIEDEEMEEVEPLLVAEEKLQQLIGQFVNRVDEVFQEHTALGEVLKQNEQFMTTYYQCMLELTQTFIRYSKQLYSNSQPLESLRAFRTLYQSFSNCSTLLNGYTALTEEFALSQKKYIQEQVSLFEKIIFKQQKQQRAAKQILEPNCQQLIVLKQQNSELKQLLRRYEEELNKYQSESNQKDGIHSFNKEVKKQLELLKRIQQLESLIIENNDEFAVQVQKYNRLLYQEREEYKRLEESADQQIKSMQFNFRQMQKQLQSYREQKFKDQLMIENMARKLRGYQRQKRGFVSPGARINLSSGKSSALHIGLSKRQDSGLLYKRDIDF